MVLPAFDILATAPSSELVPANFWMPAGASNHVADVDAMFHWINYICYFFFVLVVGMMVVFVWKYRAKPGARIRLDGLTHHRGLELSWSIIPLLISIGIFFFGFR